MPTCSNHPVAASWCGSTCQSAAMIVANLVALTSKKSCCRISMLSSVSPLLLMKYTSTIMTVMLLSLISAATHLCDTGWPCPISRTSAGSRATGHQSLLIASSTPAVVPWSDLPESNAGCWNTVKPWCPIRLANCLACGARRCVSAIISTSYLSCWFSMRYPSALLLHVVTFAWSILIVVLPRPLLPSRRGS